MNVANHPPNCEEFLILRANPLTGTLPDSFSSLTNLSECIMPSFANSALCSITSQVLTGELDLDSTSLEGSMMSIICRLPKMGKDDNGGLLSDGSFVLSS